MKHVKFIVLAALVSAGIVWPGIAAEKPPGKLQALIDAAAAGAEVIVPAGIWEEPIVVRKGVILRGISAERSIIDVTADAPALQIQSTEPVRIESLTIRWQRATSVRTADAVALFTRDTPLTIRSVRFLAAGNKTRCPGALTAVGFSNVKIEQCHFEGFDFPIQFGQGAEGTIADTTVYKPGHAGITAGQDSIVKVQRCVVAGSEFHGIRCTGGRLIAEDNLIVGNKNRGIYLGNRSATGSIRNNVIHENTTGISGFAQSDVEVENNLISRSEYAGLDARDSCRLRVHHNIFLENTRALILFKESGVNKNDVRTNLFWANKTNTENFAEVPVAVQQDPQLKDLAHGDFASQLPAGLQGYGLTNGKVIKQLWAKWSALSNAQRP